jgi:hypothetical protein
MSSTEYDKQLADMTLDSIWNNDQHGFLNAVTGNWNNHLPMLLLGLHLTEGLVIELGSGEGSTPFLKAYCEANKREFRSYDNNKDWCAKTGAEYVEDWEPIIFELSRIHRGLVFIDHAPGERRFKDAIRMLGADIIVMHDTEEGGAGDYHWEVVWPNFRFRLNYNKSGGGAGATAVSNTIDLNRYRGLSLGPYTFDND